MKPNSSWGWNPTGRRRWAVLLLWGSHLAWILYGRGSGEGFRQTMGSLARPSISLAARWNGWLRERADRKRKLWEAEAEVRQLRKRLEVLEASALREAPRVAEADEAIRALGLRKQLPLEMRAARILVNVRKAPFGGMLLEGGKDQGFRNDQGVLCPEGVVGRIWTAGETQSSVVPLDAYNSSTAVMLARSRATGVLQGVGPGRAEIRYVGRQEIVQVGEPVFTSGLDRVFPRGLLVGYVQSVTPRDVELELGVSLAAPLDRVNLVMVLPPRPEMELKPLDGPPPVNGKNKRGAP